MQLVITSFGRALLSQLHFRMLLLTVLPFLLSLLVWGVVLWLGLQPMIDWLHSYFADNNLFQSAASVLGWFGLGAVKTVLVPLIAMWLLLPLMVVTALIFVGVIAMPAVVNHVSDRHYPQLARLRGGSLAGSLSMSLGSFLIFAGLWLVTLPLNAVPLLAFVVQPVLWGWLTYRVMAYDALSEHASAGERRELMGAHRWPLLAIGIAAGAMGAAPTLLWLGGALSVILFPLLAGVSIWLYVLVFVFSGLWFQHYTLEALARLRQVQPAGHVRIVAGR
jgi:hypothetical protein